MCKSLQLSSHGQMGSILPPSVGTRGPGLCPPHSPAQTSPRRSPSPLPQRGHRAGSPVGRSSSEGKRGCARLPLPSRYSPEKLSPVCHTGTQTPMGHRCPGAHLASARAPQVHAGAQPHAEHVEGRPVHQVEVEVVLKLWRIQYLEGNLRDLSGGLPWRPQQLLTVVTAGRRSLLPYISRSPPPARQPSVSQPWLTFCC